MRRFVFIGQMASASGDFLIDDVPGTSGRFDVQLGCLRAALLVSHGLRSDAVAYMVLLGGPRAPRTLRVDGATAKFVRPDERALAALMKKSLAQEIAVPNEGIGFAELRPGIQVAAGGIDSVLADLGPMTPYVLEEGAPDLRNQPLDVERGVFFVGDHKGFDEATRAALAAVFARPVGIGPVSVHAEDAVAIVSNELDRRQAAGAA